MCKNMANIKSEKNKVTSPDATFYPFCVCVRETDIGVAEKKLNLS